MKKLLVLLAMLATCYGQIYRPVTIDFLSSSGPQLAGYQANYQTWRVSLTNGTMGVSLSNAVPFFYYKLNQNSSNYYEATCSIVDTNNGIFDASLTPTNSNVYGNFMYGAGFYLRSNTNVTTAVHGTLYMNREGYMNSGWPTNTIMVVDLLGYTFLHAPWTNGTIDSTARSWSSNVTFGTWGAQTTQELVGIVASGGGFDGSDLSNRVQALEGALAEGSNLWSAAITNVVTLDTNLVIGVTNNIAYVSVSGGGGGNTNAFLQFDGTGFINSPAITSLCVTPYSVAMWVFMDYVVSPPAPILVNAGIGSSDLAMFLNAGCYGFWCGYPQGDPNVPGAPYSTGVWQHVGFTVDGFGTSYFYFNGLCVETNLFGTAPFPQDVLSIGSTDTTTPQFAGYMRQVGVWNAVLSDADFAALAADPNAAMPATSGDSAALALWNFDEGSGATAADRSGHGYDLTLTSGVTWTTSTGHLVAPAP